MWFSLLWRTFWASVGDIMRNGCSQHLIHTRTSVTYTLDQVWTNNEPYKSTYVQKTATTVTFTDILSVLWVISLVMADHSTPRSSEQVLKTVWTKFEPITSPRSRLRPEKQPKLPSWRDFRDFYGHVERLMSDIMGIGWSQYSTQLRTSVRNSLDQVWTNNDPYKST